MSKYLKIVTVSGKAVWINSANIVAVTESKSNPDNSVIVTNAAFEEGQYYVVPGSPEVLIGLLGEDIILS